MSEPEPCDGPGTCHGCMVWCDRCGDVLTACNATRCDRHQCQRCRRFLSRAEHDHECGEIYKECTDCLMAQPLSDTHPAWVRFCAWFVLGKEPRVLSTSAESVTSWSDELLGEAFESAELVMVVLEAHGTERSMLGWNGSRVSGPGPAAIALAVNTAADPWSTPRDQMFREGLMLLVQRFAMEIERRRLERVEMQRCGACFQPATFSCANSPPTCIAHRSACCTAIPTEPVHKPSETG